MSVEVGGLSGYKRGSGLGPVCVRWDPVHAMPSVWKREALRVDNYILPMHIVYQVV